MTDFCCGSAIPFMKESDEPALALANDNKADPAIRRLLPLPDEVNVVLPVPPAPMSDRVSSFEALIAKTCTVPLSLESTSHWALAEKAIL